MLADCPIHAALPAADLERARRFYAEKLGLTPESELADGLFYRCAGRAFFCTRRAVPRVACTRK